MECIWNWGVLFFSLLWYVATPLIKKPFLKAQLITFYCLRVQLGLRALLQDEGFVLVCPMNLRKWTCVHAEAMQMLLKFTIYVVQQNIVA